MRPLLETHPLLTEDFPSHWPYPLGAKHLVPIYCILSLDSILNPMESTL